MVSYMYVPQVREKQMVIICLYIINIIHVCVALLLSYFSMYIATQGPR